MTKRTALYRHFDANGRLLYVGISLSAVARLSQHHDKPWFTKIANMTTQWFSSRDEAHAAERKAIREEGPLHNVRHTVYQRSMSVMPPHCENGISVEQHAWVMAWFEKHPTWERYAIDFGSRVLGVSEDTICKMVVVPPGTIPRFKMKELITITNRLLRGRYDTEPPILLEYYGWWTPTARHALAGNAPALPPSGGRNERRNDDRARRADRPPA